MHNDSTTASSIAYSGNHVIVVSGTLEYFVLVTSHENNHTLHTKADAHKTELRIYETKDGATLSGCALFLSSHHVL